MSSYFDDGDRLLRVGQVIARRYGSAELRSIFDEAEGQIPLTQAPAQGAPTTPEAPRVTKRSLRDLERYTQWMESRREAGDPDPVATFRALPDD